MLAQLSEPSTSHIAYLFADKKHPAQDVRLHPEYRPAPHLWRRGRLELTGRDLQKFACGDDLVRAAARWPEMTANSPVMLPGTCLTRDRPFLGSGLKNLQAPRQNHIDGVVRCPPVRTAPRPLPHVPQLTKRAGASCSICAGVRRGKASEPGSTEMWVAIADISLILLPIRPGYMDSKVPNCSATTSGA